MALAPLAGRRAALSPVLAPTVAAVLAALALGLRWRGVDWPAQLYRVNLFRTRGWVAFDTGWYGGHSPLSYSVIFPPLAAWLGLRVTAAASAVAASWAFDRIARRRYGDEARLGSLFFAAGTLVPVAIGQLPFLLGLALALGAILAQANRRPKLAAALALGSALASPVTGGFLGLGAAVAASTAPPGSRRAPALLGAAALVPTALLPLLYQQAGRFPFRAAGLAMVVTVSAAAVALLPRRERGLRVGAALYGVLATGLFVAPNPLGGVVSRVGMALCLPVLACTVSRKRRHSLAVLAVPLLIWQWAPAVTAMTTAGRDPSTHLSYFTPLTTELQSLQAAQSAPARLEIPFTELHGEAAWVAPVIPLARGWDRQVDTVDNAIFYDKVPLTADSYHAWLNAHGVEWVALPDVPLDYSAETEAALLRTGLAYLEQVWQNPHWTLWRVAGSPGLASNVAGGPAHLASLGSDRFVVVFDQPGDVLVRVRYSTTWAVASGDGCIGRTTDGWTQVHADQAGPMEVVARLLPFSASRC